MFGKIKSQCGRTRQIVLVVSAILGVLWLGNHLRDGYKVEDAAGIYLVDGGKYLFVVEHSPETGLWLSEGAIRALPERSSDGAEINLSFQGGEMVYSHTQVMDLYSASGPWKGTVDVRLYLAPSKRNVGDWDLVNGEIGYSGDKSVAGNGQADLSDDYRLVPYDRSDPPLRSYFHRVDDERIRAYFKMRKESGPNKEQHALIESIMKDHPGDLFLELHAIEMEALVGDADRAHEMLGKWKVRNSTDPRDPLMQSAYLVGNIVSLYMAEKRGYPKDSEFTTSPTTVKGPKAVPLVERLEWLKKLPDYDYLTPNVVFLSPDWGGRQIPNFLEVQVQAKVFSTLSNFALLRGDREESLAILAGSYRLGQSMGAGYWMITKLIGIAVQGIAAKGMEMHILNACETPEEFERCREMLDRLYEVPYRSDINYLLVDEIPSFVNSNAGKLAGDNFREAGCRLNCEDARFEILRTALSAKHCLLRTKGFPRKDEDFAPFFERGLPKDPFASGSINYKLRNPDRFCVYSVGPDKDDDSAAILYDSSNGTTSDGDIYLDIPREREFPFPKDGVRAKNADELLAQFPNGLPMDYFGKSSYGKYPLSIIESTERSPVRIVSCGPDQNHPGTLGDIVSAPSTTPNLSFLQQEQCVYLPAGRVSFGSGNRNARYWDLQPMYDPINGTTSMGDIFMEVPR